MNSWRARLRAFLIHLIFSVLVISLFLVIVTQIWFPGPLFKIENVWQGLSILIPVDAIIGPLLTLIIFAPGKKGLKIDLSIIAALQIGALIYGGYLIYAQRPVAFAFVVDRFEVIVASESYSKNIPLERFSSSERNFPLLTYVIPAQSEIEKSKFLVQGINVKKQPDRHYPIKQYIHKIKEKALDSQSLNPTDTKSKELLEKFNKKHQHSSNLLLLPLQGTTYDSIIVVIHATSGNIMQYIEVDPWASRQ